MKLANPLSHPCEYCRQIGASADCDGCGYSDYNKNGTHYIVCPDCKAPLAAAVTFEDNDVIEFRAVCYTYPDACTQTTIYFNLNKHTNVTEPKGIVFTTQIEYDEYYDRLENWNGEY